MTSQEEEEVLWPPPWSYWIVLSSLWGFALMLYVFWELIMQNPTRIPKRFLGKFQCSSSESLTMAPVTPKLPEHILCLLMNDFFVLFLLDQISQPRACGTVGGPKNIVRTDSTRICNKFNRWTWWVNQNQPGVSGCHPRRSRPFLWKLSWPLTYERYFLLFLCVCLPHIFQLYSPSKTGSSRCVSVTVFRKIKATILKFR